MTNSNVIFTNREMLIEDLGKWKQFVYCSSIESNDSLCPTKLAAITQQYFNEISTTYFVGEITFILHVNGRDLSVLSLSQPIRQCTKTVISDSEARYIVELENCKESISLLGINNFDI